MSCFLACDQVFLKKSHRIFIQQKFKICSNMHFGFNNQFIKAMRTRPIFQKKTQKYFALF
jgi:hypothetical protein